MRLSMTTCSHRLVFASFGLFFGTEVRGQAESRRQCSGRSGWNS